MPVQFAVPQPRGKRTMSVRAWRRMKKLNRELFGGSHGNHR